MLKKIILASFLLFCCGILAPQFVVKKPVKTKKEPSRSQLQEQCCKELGSMLGELPVLLTQIAEIQQFGITEISGFFAGDATNFMGKSDKDQLQERHKQVVELSRYLKEVTRNLTVQIKKLPR
jgi:hypothetical protein